MFLIKLAFRNILRNRRRTIITVLAISIGLASMIFTDAVSYGYLDAMIKYLTPLSFEPGELIIKEGSKGDAFYIITAGKVEVFINDA